MLQRGIERPVVARASTGAGQWPVRLFGARCWNVLNSREKAMRRQVLILWFKDSKQLAGPDGGMRVVMQTD